MPLLLKTEHYVPVRRFALNCGYVTVERVVEIIGIYFRMTSAFLRGRFVEKYESQHTCCHSRRFISSVREQEPRGVWCDGGEQQQGGSEDE